MKDGKTRPPEQELAKYSDDKRFFLAVSNYMANVLGIDRNYIQDMLDERIKARNVDQLILEHVQRYFGFGRGAYSRDGRVDAKIAQTVDQCVKKQMEAGASAMVDKLVQNELERLFRNARLEDQGLQKPGLERARSWHIDLRLVNACIAQWLEARLPGRQVPFEAQLRPSGSLEISVTVRGLNPADSGVFAALDGRPMETIISRELYADGVSRILEDQLSLPRTHKLTACKDGVILSLFD